MNRRAGRSGCGNRFFKRHVFGSTGTDSPAQSVLLGSLGLVSNRTPGSRSPAACPESFPVAIVDGYLRVKAAQKLVLDTSPVLLADE